jgi:group I intron endonuclease
VSLLNKNLHHNHKLQNAWDKYKNNNFDFIILEKCEINFLIKREQYYIDLLKPNYNHRKIAESNLGLKSSSETKNKISASLKEYYYDNPDICLKVSDKMKGNKINLGRNSKKKDTTICKESVDKMRISKSTKNILQLDLSHNLIKEWSNMIELCETLNINNGNILRCCKNKRKTYKNFIWKFKN